MSHKTWTEEDLRELRELVEGRASWKMDWDAIRDRFPNRSKASIYKQMNLHGMTRSRAWTPAEDDLLLKSWNEVGSRTMAKRLKGRTACGIYERARKLGLHGGTPQGMVSVRALSNDPRWGYDYYKSLKIFKAHDVVLHRFSYTSMASRPRGTLYVEEADARDAAEAWEKAIADQRVGKETPKEAAKRLGVRSHVLARWLTDGGLLPPLDESTKRKFWAAPSVYDAVVAKHRKPRWARPEGQECPVEAAKRLGVPYDTLQRWLREDGVKPPRPKNEGKGKMFCAPVEVYDRVYARHRPKKIEVPSPESR
jgi:transposase